MRLIEISNKEAYFKKNYPFRPIPKLTDKRFCIHCFEWITIGDFKVQQIAKTQLIVCPNAPECHGTIIDWYKQMQ
jgi:hypothetical protein